MADDLDYSDVVEQAALDNRFLPHTLNKAQAARVASLREGAWMLSRHVLKLTPPSWERDEALRAIDQACSWAEKAVSRNE